MLLPDDNTPLSAKEERRYQKLNAKAWKEKQKTMSKGAFYDYVESLLGDDPTNAKGDIPQYAVKWYQEHKKKGSRQSGKKGWDVENPFLPSGQDPMADHSADFAMLNSGEGTAAEYTQAYDNIAVPTAKNMTNEQKKSIRSYMGGSEPINSYLRNETDNPVYPSKKTLPTVQKEIADITARGCKIIRCRGTSRPIRASQINTLP